jgi:phosphoglucomutase/phosphomannomutase
MTPQTSSALTQLDEAAAAGKLSAGAVENVRLWLTEDRYADYAEQVAEHIEQEQWQQLDDAFWTIIPFGTGGRRGRMYPIGSNAINDRTIGESAQGLADYVNECHVNATQGGSDPPACAIAYDTRHRSREFAELCAEVMVAAGIKVFFLDGYRSTPELSFCVRYKKCACGIMVTASHNPPSDNAVKAYWSSGAQLLPPHDKAVIDRVMQVQQIHRTPFDEAIAAGQVEFCQDEVDLAFFAAVKMQQFPGPRDLKIIYSPLHGVGASAICPALTGDGFTDVELFAPHAEPDGDFPNVPGHVSNPENPAVFDAIIERAQKTGAELILASDPDCDRIGVAAPLTSDTSGPWATFTGNQIGALMTDWVLSQRQKSGTLSPDHYLVKTLVTTEMIRRIGEGYGVKTHGNLLVGFKWIGGLMDEQGADKFLLGLEESHGYLVGQHVRDKDAAVAAMLMAELAAAVKAEGQTLHQKLEALYWQFGYHGEHLFTQTMPGSEGMQRMKTVMAAFRDRPPQKLAGLPVASVRDYQSQTVTASGESPKPLDGPQGDMVILDLSAEGNYIAVRPSGTEPKVKFYLFTYQPAELLADLEDTRDEMNVRLERLQRDLVEFVESA